MNKQHRVITVISLIVVGAVSFFVGMQYQKQQAPAFPSGRFSRENGQGSMRLTGQGFRPVTGEIINSDDTSLTVKLADGSSKIVLLSDKTLINKANQAGKSDLTIGEIVNVFGTEQTQGSITAQSITIGQFQMRN